MTHLSIAIQHSSTVEFIPFFLLTAVKSWNDILYGNQISKSIIKSHEHIIRYNLKASQTFKCSFKYHFQEYYLIEHCGIVGLFYNLGLWKLKWYLVSTYQCNIGEIIKALYKDFKQLYKNKQREPTRLKIEIHTWAKIYWNNSSIQVLVWFLFKLLHSHTLLGLLSIFI